MGVADPLSGYRFQALPDLSGLRDPPRSIKSAVRSVNFGPNEQAKARHVGVGLQALIRAAFARVLLGYIDSPEFLFAEASSDSDLENSLTLIRCNLAEFKTWSDFAQQLEQHARSDVKVSVESVRATLDLPAGKNSLPARFVNGALSGMEPAGLDGVLLLGLPPVESSEVSRSNHTTLELWAICDEAIVSQTALDIYLDQVCATVEYVLDNLITSPTSVIPLPRKLQSAYEETYDGSRAHVVAEWLIRNANQRPHAVAHEIYRTLDESPTILTFAELNWRSNRLVHWFLQHGVQPEDKVAVCRSRDEHFYVANAALFKSGACYVSIDPELPLERRQFIARDSGAKFVITTAQLAPDFGDAALVLEDKNVEGELAEQPDENVCYAQLDSLAYLLYTSGTTGTPKGCLLNHRGVYWAIEAMCTYPRPITQPDTDKRLALASIAFDVHISEICQAWCLGIRLVSAPRYEILADLQENLINLGITHAGMVPSMIEATLTGPDDLPLKYLVSGGEKISDSLLRKWANHPSLILANFYGPTEATIGCTSRLIKQTDRKENIGHPFPSCRAYVVDASMSIVPRGNPGELVVEGPLVGKGYHNLPDATAKAFKNWPSENCNAYRTGDLVRMMPDDTIEIMGRIDTQIKLRGVRIESEGVSNVLRKASEQPLDVATLIAKHPDSGSELLVSFVAFGDRQVPVSERRSGRVELARDFPLQLMQSLKAMATRELAVYMRPSHIIPLAFLPLSLNMKTDTKLLAEFFRSTPVPTLLEAQNARNSVSVINKRDLDSNQHSIAQIVSRLSKTPIDVIQADSNLFECGMDSIKLSALARELRALRPRSRITVTKVLSNPVLSDLAQLYQSSDQADSIDDSSVCDEFDRKWRVVAETIFRPEDIEAVLPTFPVQDGVLFQALVSPSQYIQHFAYRIEPRVTIEDLHRAWSDVIRRHPILRAAFVVEGTPLQVVLRPGVVYVPLSTHDQSPNIEQDTFGSWFKSSEMRRIAVEINDDMTTPAFRINIYGANDRFMVVSLSHAIYDGIVVPNLMADVDAAVAGQRSQKSEQLQPILDAIDATQHNAQEFWVHKFSQVDLKSQIMGRSTESSPKHIRRTFSTISYEALQSACRSKRTTMQALGCASFALAGRDYFGWQEKALFGIIRSGRSLTIDGVEAAVVPLVSVVPFLLSMAGKLASDLLQESQAELISTSAYEHTPLGRIQRWIGSQLLFNALFSCRIEESRVSYRSFKHLQTDSPPPEFALAVEMLANPLSNTMELRVAFTEDISTTDMDDIVSRMESHMEYFCNADSSIQSPLSSTSVITSAKPSSNDPETSEPNKVDPALEKSIIAIVASFLNVESTLVGPTSSLVSLGLTSLKAVALARKLKDSSFMVSAVDIIQADNIRGIASQCANGPALSEGSKGGQEWLDDLHREIKEELLVDGLRLTSKDQPRILCATALQAGMLSQTISSSDRLYVHGFTFKLRPDCSIEKLKAAWQQTIRETSILRTSFAFAADCGRWGQVVHSEFDLPWSSKSFSNPSSALSELISTLPFQEVEDFSRPPIHLCHSTFENVEYLLVVLHHALYDGMSLPLLFDRVRTIYYDKETPYSTSFHDLVPQILMQEHDGTAYWAKQLQEAPPFTFPRKVGASGGAWRSSARCDVDSTEIERTCRRYQVNVQCLGQAVMAKVLSQMLNQRDVVFGQVVSGRMLPGAESVIGPVFNTIPCRVDMSTSKSYGDLLRKFQRSNNESLTYQHASLRAIQRELGVKYLTDALFLFQPDASVESELTPIWESLENANKDETKAQYGLNVELHQTVSGFLIRASCRADVMDRTELSELLDRFSHELRNAVLHPTSSIFNDSLSILASTNPTRNLPAVQEPESRIERSNTDDSEFDGWSTDQLKFKDIVIKFTKVPSSTVRPSSQLASLGLDSISAIQLAGIAKRAGISLSATDVAGSTTLADVAKIIAKRSGSTKPQPLNASVAMRPLLDEHVTNQVRLALPASLRDFVEDVLPTTPGMDFMLSACYRSGGWRFQHVFAFKVSGGTDASKLYIAWDQLIQRHAILRSVFANVERQNVLCVLRPGVVHTPWTNAIVGGNRSDLEEVGQRARSLVTNPPQLRGGPAAGITYLHGKESDYMILGMHHALYDAWSFNILINDLQDLYSGKPLTNGNDLAYLARTIASPENRDEQRAYWQSTFDGFRSSIVESTPRQSMVIRSPTISKELRQQVKIPLALLFGALQGLLATHQYVSRRARGVFTNLALAASACLSIFALARMLPLFRSFPSRDDSSTDSTITPRKTHTHSVFRDLVLEFSALQARATERNLPLHMVLLACWAKAQAKRSAGGNKDVVFGLIHSGRGLDGVEEIGAPCINMLPVYVRDALGNNAFVVAERLQADLKLRSPVVEQSRLQDVSSWIGAPGQPLFHYFVNLLRVPSSIEGGKTSGGVLERIKVPVDSSSVRTADPSAFQTSSFPAMGEVLDDCMVEIFFDSKKDSIGMEMTCQAHTMTEIQARELAEAWAKEVRDAFSS